MRIRREVFFGLLQEERAIIDRLIRNKIVTAVIGERGHIIVARWGTNKTALKKILKEA